MAETNDEMVAAKQLFQDIVRVIRECKGSAAGKDVLKRIVTRCDQITAQDRKYLGALHVGATRLIASCEQ